MLLFFLHSEAALPLLFLCRQEHSRLLLLWHRLKVRGRKSRGVLRLWMCSLTLENPLRKWEFSNPQFIRWKWRRRRFTCAHCSLGNCVASGVWVEECKGLTNIQRTHCMQGFSDLRRFHSKRARKMTPFIEGKKNMASPGSRTQECNLLGTGSLHYRCREPCFVLSARYMKWNENVTFLFVYSVVSLVIII